MDAQSPTPVLSPALREQIALKEAAARRRLVDQVMPDVQVSGAATVIRKADKDAAARGERPAGETRQ